MKIDPRQLMQLSAIVETGGLTEAAGLLGSSQPALSRTLSALEARLGQPLVLRDRRPLQPTALGRALAEQGDAIRLATRRSASRPRIPSAAASAAPSASAAPRSSPTR